MQEVRTVILTSDGYITGEEINELSSQIINILAVKQLSVEKANLVLDEVKNLIKAHSVVIATNPETVNHI